MDRLNKVNQNFYYKELIKITALHVCFNPRLEDELKTKFKNKLNYQFLVKNDKYNNFYEILKNRFDALKNKKEVKVEDLIFKEKKIDFQKMKLIELKGDQIYKRIKKINDLRPALLPTRKSGFCPFCKKDFENLKRHLKLELNTKLNKVKILLARLPNCKINENMITVLNEGNVNDIKKRISEIISVPVSKFQLVENGRILKNQDKTVARELELKEKKS